MEQYFTLDGKPLFKADPCREEPASLDLRSVGNIMEECRTYIAYLSDALREDGGEELTVEGETLKRVLGLFHVVVNDLQPLVKKVEALCDLRERGVVLKWEGKRWALCQPELDQLHNSDPELLDLLRVFNLEMGKDLLRADLEGKAGWDSEDEQPHFVVELEKHIAEGRWVGAANFCMFLHHLDQEKKRADQADSGGSPDDN